MKKYFSKSKIFYLFIYFFIAHLGNSLFAQDVPVSVDASYSGIQFTINDGPLQNMPYNSQYPLNTVLNIWVPNPVTISGQVYFFKDWKNCTVVRGTDDPFSVIADSFYHCAGANIYIEYEPARILTVTNSFGSGNVLIDGSTFASGEAVPVNPQKRPHIAAIDRQNSGGYVQVFRYWEDNHSKTSLSRDLSVSDLYSLSYYTAHFDKECNLTFQNYYAGSVQGGTIKINNVNYTSSYTFAAVANTPVSVEADQSDVTLNYIIYSFNHWENASSSRSRTITPTSHNTYTAYFTGKPTPVTITSYQGDPGQNVHLVWQEHPNANVSQYQIWRQVIDGYGSSSVQVATINRGTTSWTDPDWKYPIKDDSTTTTVLYDVRAYYSTEGTTADPNYVEVWASKTNPKKSKTIADQMDIAIEENPSTELPTDYSIQNYPNPFNPTTTFSIQVPNTGFVQLKIYDHIGREVATLVNKVLSQGTYNIKFDGNALSSGIYVYKISAGNFNKIGKIMLIK